MYKGNFSGRLQHIIDKTLGPAGWSRSLAPDRLFLSVLDDKDSYGALIVNSLMRHWEIERVRQRIERSLDTPGKPEVFTLKDPGQLCEFLERNLGIVYGDNLPPTINSAHVMFALLNDRRLLASRYISLYFVRPIDIFQYIVRLPATEEFVPRFSRSN